jgi:apolipoprotein D and lipocalin family protein
MFHRLLLGLVLGLVAPLSACATQKPRLVPTTRNVELPRYMGQWHEVARLPVFFQKGCTGSTAEYTLNPDNTVGVVNRCVKNGQPRQVRGTATVVDTRNNAVLEVRFKEWFSVFIPRAKTGNYFILWLEPDYSAAAVGASNSLWILSRKPSLPAAKYARIVEHCRSLGYPVEKLIVEPAQLAGNVRK